MTPSEIDIILQQTNQEIERIVQMAQKSPGQKYSFGGRDLWEYVQNQLKNVELKKLLCPFLRHFTGNLSELVELVVKKVAPQVFAGTITIQYPLPSFLAVLAYLLFKTSVDIFCS